MHFDIVQWLSSVDIAALLFEIVQCVFVFFAFKRKKNGASTIEDLTALAEYHEKAAKRIREEIKNKGD